MKPNYKKRNTTTILERDDRYMIQNKKDYIEYLEADRVANFKTRKKPRIYGDYCWKYLRIMRKYEYLINCRSDVFSKICCLFVGYKFARMRLITGIQISENVFGKGLGLFHYGSIVVNETARFGDYCVIQNGVNISKNVTGGDRIYLAPGAKINGDVHIANGVIIGSNAVVTHSIEEENTTWAGIPAKKISDKGYRVKEQ